MSIYTCCLVSGAFRVLQMLFSLSFFFFFTKKDINIVLDRRKAHRIADSSWFLSLRKWDLLKRLMRMLLLVPAVCEGFGITGRLLGSGLGLGKLLLQDRPGLYFYNLLALRVGS